MTKSYSFVFDLDGVLADWTHRLMYDGEKFYEEMLNDPAIPAGAVLFNMLVTQAQIIGHAIQHGKEVGVELQSAEVPFVDIWTCRPERTRLITQEWLGHAGLLMPRRILMRDDLDVRPHHRIKMEWYRNFYESKGEQVFLIFEDNADTIKAFRDEGITVYQTQESPLN